jgi:hypothetical protein
MSQKRQEKLKDFIYTKAHHMALTIVGAVTDNELKDFGGRKDARPIFREKCID